MRARLSQDAIHDDLEHRLHARKSFAHAVYLHVASAIGVLDRRDVSTDISQRFCLASQEPYPPANRHEDSKAYTDNH